MAEETEEVEGEKERALEARMWPRVVLTRRDKLHISDRKRTGQVSGNEICIRTCTYNTCNVIIHLYK